MSIAGEGVRKQGSNRTWLVKSGERILGPYTGEEVVQRLRSKEFVAIDEVVSPLGRWRYVRDEPVFMTVVEEIRRGMMHQREDTEVQGATQTETRTHTETTTDVGTQTTTEPISPFLDDGTPTPVDSVSASTIRDAQYVDSSSGDFSRASSSDKSTRQVRQFGVGSENTVRKRVSRFAQLLWLVTVGVVGAAGYFVMQSRGAAPQVVAPDRMGEFKIALAKANAAWEIGDLAAALKFYHAANEISPGRADASVREALLMLKLEGQTVAAKRMLEETLEHVSDIAIAQEAKIGLGLAHLISEEYDEAVRKFLDASMRGPNSNAAKFNAGASAYMAHDFSEAVSLFRDSGDEPAATLMLARSALALSGNERQQEREKAAELLENLIKTQADFRQEAQIIAAYLHLESGNKRRALALAKGAFESDPLLTSEHYHSPLLYLEPLEWHSLVPLCRELNDKLKTAVTRAMLAICMEKSGQRQEALRMINDGLASSPNESTFHAANAYVLMVTGREVDAKASLRLAMKEGESALTQTLSGRVCQRLRESDCVEKAWAKLSQNLPAGLAALPALAEIKRSKNESVQAQEMVSLALSVSPRYLPAIRMRSSGGQ